MTASRRQVVLGATSGLLGVALLPAVTAPAATASVSRRPRPRPVAAEQFPAATAIEWVDVAYNSVLKENLSPPAAARAYAYTAVAMYEATRAGIPNSRSLSGQLTGLVASKSEEHREGSLDWPLVVAYAAASALGSVLPFQAPTTRPALDQALAQTVSTRKAAGVTARTADASAAYVARVMKRLNPWFAADGYSAIVGRPYTPPVGDGLWVSTPPNYRPAVEPYWSTVRPLVLRRADEIKPPKPIPFDPNPASAFGQQAMAPYRQSFVNTDDQKAIARFWTDNPGSFTPPLGTATGLPSGHWMQICSIALRQSEASLAHAVQAYARVGITLHDAFLNCWTWKYRYNLLRPITYINRYVDPAWTTFVNTPQFPEYSSGHSVASPAAAIALRAEFGEFAYVDDSPVPRGLPARSFSSFMAAAKEAAASRLYGGIHYPMAIEGGFTQGEKVGALVQTRLRFTRDHH